MSDMQPVCSRDKRKLFKIDSEVELTKMRTKTCYVCFFKCSLNKRAVALILELDKGNISTLVKFEYQNSSSKNELGFEKTNMIFHLLFTK